MGIKHFFSWFRNQFNSNIINMKNQTFLDINVQIDNLMIDMNGIFHNSTQKIYEYGSYKPRQTLLAKHKKRLGVIELQIRVFEDICRTVEYIFNVVKPMKRLILCVDGPAPTSKQAQQRQRRFRSAKENTDEHAFDSNCLTPGTKFMDYLTKYIDWYIRKRISEDERWQNTEVVFSTEKTAGEGEHKVINYIRRYGDPSERFCLHGMDADLIMLTLGTQLPHFHILREDMYDRNNEFFCIDIGNIRGQLSELMRWDCENDIFNPEIATNDFIFMCFMVGNDFLPHITGLEIIEKGIEIMLEVYKNVGTRCGHLTRKVSGNVLFNPVPLSLFLEIISGYEQSILENKMLRKNLFFQDLLLENCAKMKENGKYEINILKYRQDYCTIHFPDMDMEKVSHDYLEGLQWVLSYYIKGVPNWQWKYNYHYAPPALILSQNISTFNFPVYGRTAPSTPFQQLLCVLPPKSANMIPQPLNRLLLNESSPLKQFCPSTFEIDVAGKRQEWEGTVILPFVDTEIVRNAYFEMIGLVDKKELRRNFLKKSLVYKFSPENTSSFQSYYGDIQECRVSTQTIDI